MSSRRPLHVTLTGDLSGDYVVVEERSDGSLLVAPDTSKRRVGAARRPGPEVGGTSLSRLLTRSEQATTSVPEALKAWGVELGEEELVRDFLLAEIDGRTGFVAITSERFIFAAHTGRGLAVVQENLLSAAHNVERAGRRRKHKLRVTWHGSESLIQVPDQDALLRLERHLAAHPAI